MMKLQIIVSIAMAIIIIYVAWNIDAWLAR